jgi:hypothetical protein
MNISNLRCGTSHTNQARRWWNAPKHTHTRACKHADTHIQARTCSHTQRHTHTHTNTHTHTHTRTHTRLNTHTHTHAHSHTHTHTHIHTHTHAHTHTFIIKPKSYDGVHLFLGLKLSEHREQQIVMYLAPKRGVSLHLVKKLKLLLIWVLKTCLRMKLNSTFLNEWLCGHGRGQKVNILHYISI